MLRNQEINNESEINRILKGLSNDIISEIFQSNLLVGILTLNCYFKRGGNAPIPSVISSKLINVEFYSWSDINSHLENYSNNKAISRMNFNNEDYKRAVHEISKNEKALFCFSIALFIESQMKVFSQSPYPVQEVVERLTTPIFEDNDIFKNYDSPIPSDMYNAQIYITLHYGESLFVQVNFSDLTMQNWMNELEAGIALTIPQLIDFSITNLEEPENLLLKEIIRNEFLSWSEKKPKIGENRKWSWLPCYKDLMVSEVNKNANGKNTEDRQFKESSNESNLSNRTSTLEKESNIPKIVPNYEKYIIYGLLMILPIPFINWLWLILGIIGSKKEDWSGRISGIGIQLAIGFGGRFLLGLIISAIES